MSLLFLVARHACSSFRRVGYNLNVMQQSACLVFYPIIVDNSVGRASDAMMASNSSYSF